MKNIVLLGLACVFTNIASAQSYATDRGALQVGGTAYFVSNSTGVEGERATSVAFQPAVRYFFVPNLAVGSLVGLTYSSFAGHSSMLWNAAPSLSYFFGSPDHPVRPVVGASFGLIGGKEIDLGTNLDLSGGVIMMLSPAVGLTAKAFFNDSLGRPSDRNAFGVRVGVSTFVW
jgi:hypothetical protein